jgi:hypothetical protein
MFDKTAHVSTRFIEWKRKSYSCEEQASTGIQNPNCNVKNWGKNDEKGLILKMNYTLTKSNIFGKKDAEDDFDSICTNHRIYPILQNC